MHKQGDKMGIQNFFNMLRFGPNFGLPQPQQAIGGDLPQHFNIRSKQSGLESDIDPDSAVIGDGSFLGRTDIDFSGIVTANPATELRKSSLKAGRPFV